jgi:hypothetical protein
MHFDIWQGATLAVWLVWIAIYWQGGYAFVKAARANATSAGRSRSGLLIELVVAVASVTVLAGGVVASWDGCPRRPGCLQAWRSWGAVSRWPGVRAVS